MIYRLVIEKKVAKAISKLPAVFQKRIDAAIITLRHDPFLGKKLEGEFAGAWSLRVWPYRIIYVIHQETVTITILRVGHRQGVYK